MLPSSPRPSSLTTDAAVVRSRRYTGVFSSSNHLPLLVGFIVVQLLLFIAFTFMTGQHYGYNDRIDIRGEAAHPLAAADGGLLSLSSSATLRQEEPMLRSSEGSRTSTAATTAVGGSSSSLSSSSTLAAVKHLPSPSSSSTLAAVKHILQLAQQGKGAIKTVKGAASIPAFVHQTWKSKDEDTWSEEIKTSVNSFRANNPSYSHFLWDDADMQEFVQKFYGQFYQLFVSLPKPVLRADLFRYMVLAEFGGVYSDVDTVCLKPIDEWVPEAELNNNNISVLVGIEADAGNRPDWHDWYARQLQWCQWTFAAAPHHPVFEAIVRQVLSRATIYRDDLNKTSVMELTGPGVWTDTFNSYLDSMGVSWKDFQGLPTLQIVKDTVVYGITSFSPGVGHMGSRPLNDPSALVKHMFVGSWKNNDQSRCCTTTDQLSITALSSFLLYIL